MESAQKQVVDPVLAMSDTALKFFNWNHKSGTNVVISRQMVSFFQELADFIKIVKDESYLNQARGLIKYFEQAISNFYKHNYLNLSALYAKLIQGWEHLKSNWARAFLKQQNKNVNYFYQCLNQQPDLKFNEVHRLINDVDRYRAFENEIADLLKTYQNNQQKTSGDKQLS